MTPLEGVCVEREKFVCRRRGQYHGGCLLVRLSNGTLSIQNNTKGQFGNPSNTLRIHYEFSRCHLLEIYRICAEVFVL